jgi:HK97 family phage major capsid protein
MVQNKGLRTTNAQVANEILTDYKQAIEDYKQTSLPVRSLFCAEYKSDTGGPINITFAKESMAFQEIEEGSVPDFQKTDYTTIQIDVKEYALRVGVTRIMIEDSRFDEVQNALNEARRASDRLVLDKIVAKLKDGWYNGSLAEAPPTYGANTFQTTHDHILETEGTGITLAKITKWIQLVNEHGFTADTIWINSKQLKEIQDLAAFTAGGVPMNVRESVQLGGRIGSILGLDVVVNDYMPADRVLVVDRSAKPLAFVERRALTVEAGDATFGIVDSYLSQRFGVGVRYPGAGVYAHLA